MRRRGTAKQRIWVGPNRYRGGCRNAGANANCFANTCIKRYSVRGVNANAYPKHPSNSYSDSFSHSYGYRYSAAGNADTYSDTDATTYRDTDAKFAPVIAHASA